MALSLLWLHCKAWPAPSRDIQFASYSLDTVQPCSRCQQASAHDAGRGKPLLLFAASAVNKYCVVTFADSNEEERQRLVAAMTITCHNSKSNAALHMPQNPHRHAAWLSYMLQCMPCAGMYTEDVYIHVCEPPPLLGGLLLRFGRNNSHQVIDAVLA